MNASASEIEFFLTSVSREVRTMPVTDARNYLRGLLVLIGETTEVEPLRAIFRHLDGADTQLELIATRQLKLDLRA